MQGIPLSSPVLLVLNCRSESLTLIQRGAILPRDKFGSVWRGSADTSLVHKRFKTLFE